MQVLSCFLWLFLQFAKGSTVASSPSATGLTEMAERLQYLAFFTRILEACEKKRTSVPCVTTRCNTLSFDFE